MSVPSLPQATCAVVGLGHGLEDVYTAVNHPRWDVRAVCDVDPEPASWLRGDAELSDSAKDISTSSRHLDFVRELRDDPATAAIDYVDDYAALLARDDIEAIVLVVPDLLHTRFTLAALEAGKYVLCTKPMAQTLNESLDVAAAARAHPGHYMLGFQMSYSPFARTLLDLVADGAVGTPRQLRFDYHRAPWRPMHAKRYAVVDGAIVKESTHWLDLTYRLNGELPWRAVSGFGANDALGDSLEFEDNGLLLIDYDGFRFCHSFSYFRNAEPMEDVLLVGERGTVRGTFSRLTVENDGGARTIDVPGRVLPYSGHVGYYEMFDRFAAMVLDGEEPYTNWRTGLENMLTCHAAQLAVMDGRTVRRDELRDRDWRVLRERRGWDT